MLNGMRVVFAVGVVVSTLASVAAPILAQDVGPHAAPNLHESKPLNGRFLSQPRSRNAVLKTNGDPGDDDTAISLAPNLSALCQSYIGGSTPYANPTPNVDMINGDTIMSAGSQTGCSAAQNETTIAVNPQNPRNLVGGTNDYRVFNSRENRNDGSGWAYTSFDGGATWSDIQLPHLTFQTGATGALSDMDSAGDPVVAFGPRNTVYYANLVFSRFNDGSGGVVNVSHDGGRTWGEPSIVQIDGVDASGAPTMTTSFNDKEWITVDPQRGTVYVTWTRFDVDGTSPIVVSSSRDGGRTWSPFIAVNPTSSFEPGGITPYSQGSSPQVDNDGHLYIAYESAVCQSLACDQPTDHDAVIVATYNDNRRGFTNREASFDFDFPNNPDTGRSTLTSENFRINSFPNMTIDRATGQFYITWADNRNGRYNAAGASIKTNGDVFVISSNDGDHWGQVTQIGTRADEVYPSIAAMNGNVFVSFYLRTYDPNGIGLDFAYATLNGPGFQGRARVRRITTQSENPQIQFVAVGAVTGQVLQGVFIGDYTAIALGSDLVAHPS